ncbi:MAG: hypothetical protein ACLFQV_10535, partial [Vulcanimicrobiota bacterium]
MKLYMEITSNDILITPRKSSLRTPETKNARSGVNCDSYKKEEPGIIEKSAMGWAMVADLVSENKTVRNVQAAKLKAIRKITYPLKKLWKKIEPGSDEEKKIIEDSKKELDNFAGHLKKIPEEQKIIIGGKEINKEEFSEEHPILYGLYLVCRGVANLPKALIKLMMKAPRTLFKGMFPAMYAESGNPGALSKTSIPLLKKSPWINKAYDNFSKLMNFPGVSIAMSLLGPAFGINKMADGLFEYKQGVKHHDPEKKFDGKLDVLSGTLASIQPLALLSVITEGIHLYMDYRINNKGMDPAKADKAVTTTFSAV